MQSGNEDSTTARDGSVSFGDSVDASRSLPLPQMVAGVSVYKALDSNYSPVRYEVLKQTLEEVCPRVAKKTQPIETANDVLPVCYPLRLTAPTVDDEHVFHDSWRKSVKVLDESSEATPMRLWSDVGKQYVTMPLLVVNAPNVKSKVNPMGLAMEVNAMRRVVSEMENFNVQPVDLANAFAVPGAMGVDSWSHTLLNPNNMRLKFSSRFIVQVDYECNTFREEMKRISEESYLAALRHFPNVSEAEFSRVCPAEKVVEVVVRLLQTFVFGFLPKALNPGNVTRFKLNAEGTPIAGDNPISICLFVMAFTKDIFFDFAGHNMEPRMASMYQYLLFVMHNEVSILASDKLCDMMCLVVCNGFTRNQNKHVKDMIGDRWLPVPIRASTNRTMRSAMKKHDDGDLPGDKVCNVKDFTYSLFSITFHRLCCMAFGSDASDLDIEMDGPDHVRCSRPKISKDGKKRTGVVVDVHKAVDVARYVIRNAGNPRNVIMKYNGLVGVPLHYFMGVHVGLSSKRGESHVDVTGRSTQDAKEKSEKRSVARGNVLASNMSTDKATKRSRSKKDKKEKKKLKRQRRSDAVAAEGGARRRASENGRKRSRAPSSIQGSGVNARDSDATTSATAQQHHRSKQMRTAAHTDTTVPQPSSAIASGNYVDGAASVAIFEKLTEVFERNLERLGDRIVHAVESVIKTAHEKDYERERALLRDDIERFTSDLDKTYAPPSTQVEEIDDDDDDDGDEEDDDIAMSDDGDDSSVTLQISEDVDEFEATMDVSDVNADDPDVCEGYERKLSVSERRSKKISLQEFESITKKIDHVDSSEEEYESADDDDDNDDDESDDDDDDDECISAEDSEDDVALEPLEPVDEAALKHVTLGDLKDHGGDFDEDASDLIIISHEEVMTYYSYKKEEDGDDEYRPDTDRSAVRAWRALPKSTRRALSTYMNECVMGDHYCISRLTKSSEKTKIDPTGALGIDFLSTLRSLPADVRASGKFKEIVAQVRECTDRKSFLKLTNALFKEKKKYHENSGGGTAAKSSPSVMAKFSQRSVIVMCEPCRRASSLDFSSFYHKYCKLLLGNDKEVSEKEKRDEARFWYDALKDIRRASPKALVTKEAFNQKHDKWCVLSGYPFYPESGAPDESKIVYVRISPQENAISPSEREQTFGRRVKHRVYFAIPSALEGDDDRYYPGITHENFVDQLDEIVGVASSSASSTKTSLPQSSRSDDITFDSE